MDFEGKKILVCGMARSGVAAAQCLYEQGARVSISDSKTEEKLKDVLAPLDKLDIRRCLGDAAIPQDLKSYDLVVTSPGIPLTAPILKAAKEAANWRRGRRFPARRFTPSPAPTARPPPRP